jgi:hypothetical protein
VAALISCIYFVSSLLQTIFFSSFFYLTAKRDVVEEDHTLFVSGHSLPTGDSENVTERRRERETERDRESETEISVVSGSSQCSVIYSRVDKQRSNFSLDLLPSQMQ